MHLGLGITGGRDGVKKRMEGQGTVSPVVISRCHPFSFFSALGRGLCPLVLTWVHALAWCISAHGNAVHVLKENRENK